MTGIVDRPCEGTRDLERSCDLLIDSRVRADKDRAPTIKRLTLLATSRLWEPSLDAHVWEESAEDASNGRMVGFALLWRREKLSVHLTLELLTNAGEMSADLIRDMLDWALKRTTALAKKIGADVTLSMATFEDQPRLQTLLRSSGFALQESHNIYMTCALDDATPSLDAPDGVTIHPLRDESEMERYNGLYSFTPMSVDHRLELLRSPDYIHLVAIGPSGDFMAFCECSIDREEWARGGRRTGWIEYVGVRQGLQGRGLGRAIVGEGLRWLRSHGAQTAALITMGTNIAAQRMYNAVGFAVAERDYVYKRRVGSPTL